MPPSAQRRSSSLAMCLVLLAAVARAGVAPRAGSGSTPEAAGTGDHERAERVEAALRALLATRTHPDLAWADFAGQAEHVERFYRSNGWSLAWTRNGVPTPQATSVIGVLVAADRQGLDPQDYGGHWTERLAPAARVGGASREIDAVRFDVALTVVAARYALDLQGGRVGPGRFRWHLGRADVREDIDALLQRLPSSDDVEGALGAIEPPFPAYRRTLLALARYRQLARDDGGGPLPAPRAVIEPGDAYAGVPRLVELLGAMGDLPPAEAATADGKYAGAVVEAVKRFQRRHGLEPDGRIGAETLRQLRTPLSRRVRQLELTLERWRWVPRWFAPPFIVVNIPEFRLYASDGDDRRLSMKVVVGRAYRWETPVLAADMTHLVFRPSWTVPRRMARAELAPRIEKDPSFLAADGYDVVDHQGRILPLDGDRHALAALVRSGAVRMRQRPGPRNALGGVKFVLPNVHDVYLHATPARQLFARSRRDFSHGCIRVEDPVALAGWVLRDRPGWDGARIRAAMAGDESLRVPIGEPVPVLIAYGTAIVAESGEVRFFDDVYGQDAALERALAGRRGSSSASVATP